MLGVGLANMGTHSTGGAVPLVLGEALLIFFHEAIYTSIFELHVLEKDAPREIFANKSNTTHAKFAAKITVYFMQVNYQDISLNKW